jgi:hypothetical protein
MKPLKAKRLALAVSKLLARRKFEIFPKDVIADTHRKRILGHFRKPTFTRVPFALEKARSGDISFRPQTGLSLASSETWTELRQSKDVGGRRKWTAVATLAQFIPRPVQFNGMLRWGHCYSRHRCHSLSRPIAALTGSAASLLPHTSTDAEYLDEHRIVSHRKLDDFFRQSRIALFDKLSAHLVVVDWLVVGSSVPDIG